MWQVLKTPQKALYECRMIRGRLLQPQYPCCVPTDVVRGLSFTDEGVATIVRELVRGGLMERAKPVACSLGWTLGSFVFFLLLICIFTVSFNEYVLLL